MATKALTSADFDLEYPLHVDPLFPKHTTLFVGPPQGAKSLTCISLSVCTAGGKDFLGYVTRPGPTVYNNNEHGTEDFLEKWVDKFSLGMGLDPHKLPLTLLSYQYKDFTSSQQTKSLLSCCQQVGAVLLVIDNLGSSIGGQNENYTHIMQRVFDNLLMFTEVGISVVMVHHPNKAGVTRGSTVIDAMADCIYTFERVSSRPRASILPNGEPFIEEVLEYYAVSNPKMRDSGLIPAFLIRVLENDENGAARLVNAGPYSPPSPYKNLKTKILHLFSIHPGKLHTAKQICEFLGDAFSLKDIQAALQELINEDSIDYKPYKGRFLFCETGIEPTEPVLETINEKVDKALMSLVEKYREEGKTKLLLLEFFTKPVVSIVPGLVEGNDTKLTGPSAKVSKRLQALGILTDAIGGRTYVFL